MKYLFQFATDKNVPNHSLLENLEGKSMASQMLIPLHISHLVSIKFPALQFSHL